MNDWVGPLVVLVTALLGSSGLFAYLGSRNKTQGAMVRLLLGLAYDKIATLGMHYIERGWITRDEYEEFHKDLYTPYRDFGGNGVAEQIMNQVSNLPFRTHGRYAQIAPMRRSEGENP
jgi:hypothetical protein